MLLKLLLSYPFRCQREMVPLAWLLQEEPLLESVALTAPVERCAFRNFQDPGSTPENNQMNIKRMNYFFCTFFVEAFRSYILIVKLVTYLISMHFPHKCFEYLEIPPI